MSIGSWLRDHPRLLEGAYSSTHWLFQRLEPLVARLGFDRADRWLRGPEELSKKIIFDCRMCGQCILHSTGMTCPMTCPKNLRNGPCGGVRANGNCEVIPDMRCVWVEAFERSKRMGEYGPEMVLLQPPVNRRLEGTSAWINMLTEADRQVPPGWQGTSRLPVIPLEEIAVWPQNSSQKVA
ncbi:MAG: methylenetetrahydrofolate reductase C-terminal domain-containing protein [Candidatus Promineifilaceae bacterium]|nr:methylenetetrahydrofolate reductase C-terminal domain-containing protein [Candidatus Promineifilaceae bacterium]